MTRMPVLTRTEALEMLETEFGVTGPEIYLLELVPLIEMAWAANPPRPAEIRLLYEFALRRLAELGEEAAGVEVLRPGQVNDFIERHLAKRPDPRRLAGLRQLASAVIFDHSDAAVNERRRLLILEYCLDIGAASVPHYPYGDHERFSQPEKRLMVELVDTLRPPA